VGLQLERTPVNRAAWVGRAESFGLLNSAAIALEARRGSHGSKVPDLVVGDRLVVDRTGSVQFRRVGSGRLVGFVGPGGSG